MCDLHRFSTTSEAIASISRQQDLFQAFTQCSAVQDASGDTPMADAQAEQAIVVSAQLPAGMSEWRDGRFPRAVSEILARVVHCCYGDTWPTRLGGAAAVALITSKYASLKFSACAYARSCPPAAWFLQLLALSVGDLIFACALLPSYTIVCIVDSERQCGFCVLRWLLCSSGIAQLVPL